jgi:hypothetical protein
MTAGLELLLLNCLGASILTAGRVLLLFVVSFVLPVINWSKPRAVAGWPYVISSADNWLLMLLTSYLKVLC